MTTPQTWPSSRMVIAAVLVTTALASTLISIAALHQQPLNRCARTVIGDPYRSVDVLTIACPMPPQAP